MKRAASDAVVAAANKRGRAAGVAAVASAKGRGLALINHGAGTMPVDAPAPHGGMRYSLLQDPPNAPAPWMVSAHDGRKDANGKLNFSDAPDFHPSLTPRDCLLKGIFGGCYFNPRNACCGFEPRTCAARCCCSLSRVRALAWRGGGKAGIFGRDVEVSHTEFPEAWFKGLPNELYASRRYNVLTNAYKVKSGFGQREWESKGWIHAQDPRGWMQWYFRFFAGRRSHDDARQIQRWAACASSRGRWRNQLCGAIAKSSRDVDDHSVSPVIRQTLLHWAYELSQGDYEAWRRAKSK